MYKYYDPTTDSVKDYGRYIPYFTYLRNYIIPTEVVVSLRQLPAEGAVTVDQDYRIDQIAYKLYGETAYWWVLLIYNSKTPFEIKKDVILNYPSLANVLIILSKAKIGASQ